MHLKNRWHHFITPCISRLAKPPVQAILGAMWIQNTQISLYAPVLLNIWHIHSDITPAGLLFQVTELKLTDELYYNYGDLSLALSAILSLQTSPWIRQPKLLLQKPVFNTNLLRHLLQEAGEVSTEYHVV